ncbi:MAG: transglycosylase SLT domain-containing protein [Parvularculaceae bacterium]
MKRTSLSRWTVGFLAAFAVAAGGATAAVTPRLKPPPPPPAYLSVADHAQIEAVLDAIDRRDWKRAREEAEAVADPIAKSLADWFYFNAENPNVDLEDAQDFLEAHQDWPAISRIQAHVERSVLDSVPSEDVRAFFESRDPRTGDGKLELARALSDVGQEDAAVELVRNAWINHTFTLSEERRLLARHGGDLREEDHAARVDRLLWARQVTNSRRIYSKLNARDRRMAVARAALLMRASSGPKLFDKLPPDEKMDSGVLHAAVRFYRRTKNEELAIALARQAPTTPEALRNPQAWWSERELLMRWALKNGRFADAYAMAAGAGLDPKDDYADFAEAEFDAGWIALRFLNEPERAETHFMALAAAVTSPISTARAFYWLGRAAEARGARDLATVRYSRAAAHIYTYYGQLAAEKLGGAALEAKFAPPTISTPADRARFTSRPVVAALRMLSDLDRDHDFLTFAYRVDDQLETPGEYAELAKLADRKGAPHITVRAGKVGISRGAFAPDVVYPMIFVPEEATRFSPAEILLGLSRQESEFNPRAYSRAGARGLMQLLPSTALITARKEGLRYSRAALLDDPGYNMMIGSAHLSHLFERFDDSYVMTFAAYNAGAYRVDRWIEEFGDPRDPNVDPVDWVELIPFSETRNYVQRVLENTQVYRSRLHDRPIAGRLASDLDTGGPRGRAGAGEQVSPVLILAAASVEPQSLPPLPRRTATFAADIAHETPADAETAPVADTPVHPAVPESEAAKPGEFVKSNRKARQSRRKASTLEPAPAQTNAGAFTAPATAGKNVTKAATPPAKTEKSNRVTTDKPAIIDGSEKSDALESPASTPSSKPPQITSPQRTGAIAETSQPVAPPIPRKALPRPAVDDAKTEDIADADSTDSCKTYREFIAESDEEPSAADLNAGMLAELQGGGACD